MDTYEKLLDELYSEVMQARRILGMSDEWPNKLDSVLQRVSRFLDTEYQLKTTVDRAL